MRLRPVIATTGFILAGIAGFALMGASALEIAVIMLVGIGSVLLRLWWLNKLWPDDDWD